MNVDWSTWAQVRLVINHLGNQLHQEPAAAFDHPTAHRGITLSKESTMEQLGVLSNSM